MTRIQWGDWRYGPTRVNAPFTHAVHASRHCESPFNHQTVYGWGYSDDGARAMAHARTIEMEQRDIDVALGIPSERLRPDDNQNAARARMTGHGL